MQKNKINKKKNGKGHGQVTKKKYKRLRDHYKMLNCTSTPRNVNENINNIAFCQPS